MTSPQEQRVELGIAESNLFLLPIGTLYDPFIKRGQDALNYACYQDARFILVATPSGITLAPEGGAHQSVGEPLTGIAQPGLMSFEPAYADELAILLRWAFEEIQREACRGSNSCLAAAKVVECAVARLDRNTLRSGRVSKSIRLARGATRADVIMTEVDVLIVARRSARRAQMRGS